MKKIFFSFVFITTILIATTQSTMAIDLGLGLAKDAAGKAGYDAANTTETTFAQNIGTIIKAVLSVTGIVFTALIFYAGYLWMTARGDEGNVEKAKSIIETSIVGLIIALASYGITSFVMKNIAAKAVTPPAASGVGAGAGGIGAGGAGADVGGQIP